MPDQSKSWTHRYTDDTKIMIHMFCLFSIVFLNRGEAPAEYLDLAVPDNPDQWNRRWSLEVSAFSYVECLALSPGQCFLKLEIRNGSLFRTIKGCWISCLEGEWKVGISFISRWPHGTIDALLYSLWFKSEHWEHWGLNFTLSFPTRSRDALIDGFCGWWDVSFAGGPKSEGWDFCWQLPCAVATLQMPYLIPWRCMILQQIPCAWKVITVLQYIAMSTDHSCKLICDFRLKMKSLTSFVKFLSFAGCDGREPPVLSTAPGVPSTAAWVRLFGGGHTWYLLGTYLGHTWPRLGYVWICYDMLVQVKHQLWQHSEMVSRLFWEVTCQWIVRVYSA